MEKNYESAIILSVLGVNFMELVGCIYLKNLNEKRKKQKSNREEFAMNKYKSLLIFVILGSVALLMVSCGSDESEDSEMSDMSSGGGMANMELPEDLDTSTTKSTEQELFTVAVSSEQDPLVLNEIHSWIIHVSSEEGQAVENATIEVGGGMPQHNHGFPTEPEVTTELGGGDYLLEGMKFSMGGWWELILTIKADGVSDSVTFNIVIP
ncbi:MAG: FixH family protein [Candidatus Promineifilaceae bacterium]